MIYVVSGYPRSGTSMMMECLEAGGLEMVKSEKRDELILHLKKKEIATSVHYTPLPLQPLFKNHRERIPIARKVYDQMVTLPLFADITKAEIDYVADAILDFDQMISN